MLSHVFIQQLSFPPVRVANPRFPVFKHRSPLFWSIFYAFLVTDSDQMHKKICFFSQRVLKIVQNWGFRTGAYAWRRDPLYIRPS